MLAASDLQQPQYAFDQGTVVGFAVVDFVVLGFVALGFVVLGFVVLGFVVLGFVVLGFVVLGFVALGFVALGFVALGFVALGFVALGFAVPGFCCPWLCWSPSFSPGLAGFAVGLLRLKSFVLPRPTGLRRPCRDRLSLCCPLNPNRLGWTLLAWSSRWIPLRSLCRKACRRFVLVLPDSSISLPSLPVLSAIRCWSLARRSADSPLSVRP